MQVCNAIQAFWYPYGSKFMFEVSMEQLLLEVPAITSVALRGEGPLRKEKEIDHEGCFWGALLLQSTAK